MNPTVRSTAPRRTRPLLPDRRSRRRPHQCLDSHRGKLQDDPALHMCALAYASDFSLLDATMAPRYGRTLFDKRMMPASPPIT